jgi:predicted peptidase
MVEALKKVDGNIRFTLYEGVTHDSWTRTYANPELYQWLLEQKK